MDIIASWSKPQSPWGVCGFLWLAYYYWNFISDSSTIIVPLTRLLCKQVYAYMLDVVEAFMVLKSSLSSGSVLQMLDFIQRLFVD